MNARANVAKQVTPTLEFHRRPVQERIVIYHSAHPGEEASLRESASTILRSAGLLLLLLVSICQAEQPPLRSVQVNGVVLHYIDQGHGPAVVFVHGGMEDYRAWQAQFAPLAQHFRLIAYSRRYNFPNHNDIRSDNHSAIVDADDLASLIRKLKLGPVHVVGHSYGAYISLFLSLRHPELVRSLVLSEPPIMKWLNDSPEGRPLLDDFMGNMWFPCAEAFRNDRPEAALRITVDWFAAHESPQNGASATYAQLPEDTRRFLLQDINEWKALTTSRDAFPPLSREQAAQIRKPVILLSGDHSVPALKLIARELARTLPSVQYVVFPGATHEMWSEVPQQLTAKVLPFLLEH